MGKKKDAALSGLSKKERRKLEERAAKLAAELKEREKRAAKKAAKKGKKADEPKPGKKSKALKKKIAEAVERYPEAGIDPVEAEVIEAAKEARKRAKPLKGDELKAALIADTDAGKAERDAQMAETDAEIKARVDRKRAEREAAKAADPVGAVKGARSPNAVEGETEVEYQQRRLKESADRGDAKIEALGEDGVAAIVGEGTHVAEVVETEHGREIAVGPAADDDPGPQAGEDFDFAQPSEAARDDFQTNGNGQYLVKRPSDGKLVGYTRVTTYIDAIDDTSKLTAWKLRKVLEGLAAAEEGEDTREATTARIRELSHRRDVAIAKARKADRKGKLEPGELAIRVGAAESEFKRDMDALAESLLELGGAREAAVKGTDLHALFETVDRDGMPAIHRMRQAEEITESDVRDCMAYADAMARLGAKVIDSERVIVNDAVKVPRFLPLEEYGGKPPREIGVAGRLDRTVMVKLPGRQRAGRYVLDVKTGNVEWSAGKIARQLHMYATAVGYDLETHEREDLKLDKKTGILLHVPAGTGEAHVYLVDLALGGKGNAVAAEVRAMRNEGKKAIDFSNDLLTQDDDGR